MEDIKVKISKQSNDQIARYFGYKNESTVRQWKKDEQLYKQKMQEFNINVMPFINIDEFSNFYNISKKKLNKKIDKKELPYIKCLNCDDKESPYIPFNSVNILEYKKIFKKVSEAKVITLANKKGGVGKSTTTMNLAATLAYQGFNVLIADMDTQANTTAMLDIYLGTDYTKTIIDAMYDVTEANVEEDVESLVTSKIVNVGKKLGFIGNLDILPNSGSQENESKFENLENNLKKFTNVNNVLNDVFETVKDKYDFIIIDTPPRVDITLRVSAMASDYIIMVFTAEKMSKDGIPSFLDALYNLNKAYYQQKNKKINLLGGIINSYAQNINLQKGFAMDIEDHIKEVLNELNFDYNINFLDVDDSNNIIFDRKIKRAIKIQDTQLNGYGTFLSKDSLENDIIDNTSIDMIKDYFELTDNIISRIIINMTNENEI